MNIKVIETQYKGYRFRSRLEARWAVFFDALGVAWEYEKEGYDLGVVGYYLPDFWLPQQKCWVEIKPDELSRTETDKALALAKMTERFVFVLFQVQPYRMYETPAGDIALEGSNKYFSPSGDWDGMSMWGVCPICGAKQIGHLGSHRVSYEDEWDNVSPECDRIALDFLSSALLANAYQAARSARFEHGETPRIGAPA